MGVSMIFLPYVTLIVPFVQGLCRRMGFHISKQEKLAAQRRELAPFWAIYFINPYMTLN